MKKRLLIDVILRENERRRECKEDLLNVGQDYNDNEEIDGGNGEYVIEEILGHRSSTVKPHSMDFLVHWQGFEKSEDSWVEESDMSCSQMLLSYKRKNGLTEDITKSSARVSQAPKSLNNRRRPVDSETVLKQTSSKKRKVDESTASKFPSPVPRIVDHRSTQRGYQYQLIYPGEKKPRDLYISEHAIDSKDIIDVYWQAHG
tara:strand:- start:1549 stop:2154 length:606 start_codon:yes stop_codon:yes gene_type:complete